MSLPAERQPVVPAWKIAMWTVAFQLAWFWRNLPDLLAEGAMPDTDDFLRLAQLRDFLNGQGWYDVRQYAFDAPAGADMHWSRLVEAPLAGLVWLFGLVAEPLIAERLAAIAWPILLLLATVFTVLAICRRLEPGVNPLLALLFTVTCITALTEFMPGRLDHHGVQILLFCLMLLGLVAMERGLAAERAGGKPARRGAGWLIGSAMALSLAIGLDAILLVGLILAWLGLSWAFARDDGRGIGETGLALFLAAPLAFLVSVAPRNWLVPACDAMSITYLAALAGTGIGFMALARAGRSAWLSTPSRRLPAGLGLGLAILTGLVVAFPQCAGGPYGALDPALVERWLVNVSEARGLFAQVAEIPQMWLWAIGYGAVLIAVAGFVTWHRARANPAWLALFAVLALSMAASILQYRAMRIGVFAAIPFCVTFAQMSWEAFRQRWAGERFAPMALQVATVLSLVSPTWLGLASVLIREPAPAIAATAITEDIGSATGDWRADSPYLFCNRQSDYARLAAMAPANLMAGINIGPATIVFTHHTVVGGPYHRNGAAILDMLDFFETDEATAREVARRRGIELVAWCEPAEAVEPGMENHPALTIRFRQRDVPDWLEPLSPAHERLQIFRVRG